jgi:Phosphodiester glycosidase
MGVRGACDILPSMSTARRHGRRLSRRRWLVPALALALLTPALYSYTATMMQPSSLPLGVRSVEWVRAHHGNWLVDEAEHMFYGWWKAPRKGGPALTALPRVGLPTAPSSADPTAATPASHPTSRGAPTAHWPPAVQPVVAPALAGEGVWRATGPDVAAAPPVLVTTFRPERDYPRIVAYVAWFDHTRTQLAFYPGRYEPPKAAARGPMQVPYAQRSQLLATFNAGFIYRDGRNGSSDNGHTNEPLKDGLATLVGYRDGRVDILTWHGGPDAGPGYAFTRQSLPPIVWQRKLNPALNDSTRWGFTLGNAVRVWRTGVGIDRRGNLIYAAADGQTVESLARLLEHAGAVTAMQFDINPEWPSLIAYRHLHGLVPDKIVPNRQQAATRYLVPDDRDFFAVYRRLEGPPLSVPFT